MKRFSFVQALWLLNLLNLYFAPNKGNKGMPKAFGDYQKVTDQTLRPIDITILQTNYLDKISILRRS